jgi:hypothetical protein
MSASPRPARRTCSPSGIRRSARSATCRSAPADIWTDVTAYVRKWSVPSGAQARATIPTLRFDPGTASIEFNDGDRRFDPNNLSGPYVVRRRDPGRADAPGPDPRGLERRHLPDLLRVRRRLAAVDIRATRGRTRPCRPRTPPCCSPLTNRGASPRSGRARTPAPGSPGSSTSLGWPAADRVIATGDTTLQATTLDGSVLNELQLVQDTEQGEFYLDAQGRAVFRNRQALLTDARSTTSQATFGDGGYAATGEIPYADAMQSTPGDTLVNSIDAPHGPAARNSTSRTRSPSPGTASQVPHSLDLADAGRRRARCSGRIGCKYQYAHPGPPVRPAGVQHPGYRGGRRCSGRRCWAGTSATGSQ